jgi:thiamine biosynthesis protein ThiI
LPRLKFDTVIIRFGGEIGIKADWTRKLYERRLITNIKAVLKKHAISHTTFVRKFGRLYIKTTQAEEAAKKLTRVFGISSLSPALETTSNLNNILDISTRLASLRFKKGKSFAVRCHRIGTHQYTSQEVSRQLGSSILSQLPQLKLKVNLTSPDQVLHVEVREDKAYVFTDVFKGAGGLPLGTQPKLICLMKDDTSSAVACWMTMKRGCPSVLVYFQETERTNKSSLKKATTAAKTLMEWSTGFPRKLYVVKTKENFQKPNQNYPATLKSLLRKRLMLKIAQGMAKMKNAEGIVTGDTIQKKETAQTLHAFRIQDEAAKDYPVYRPLLGLDPNEIEQLAQKIGLTKTAPQKVRHKAENKKAQAAPIRLDEITQIEKELNTQKTVDLAIKSSRVLEI